MCTKPFKPIADFDFKLRGEFKLEFLWLGLIILFEKLKFSNNQNLKKKINIILLNSIKSPDHEPSSKNWVV